MAPFRFLPWVILLCPGVAAAQKLTTHESITAGVGVNAVQVSSSMPAAAGVAIPAGPFLALTPAFEVDYDRPRVEQSLAYAFTANLQFNPDFSITSGNATYANRAIYQAHVYASPTVDALFSASVTEAPVNTIAAGVLPGQVDVATAKPGYAYNLQGAANEAVTKEFSDKWSATESGAFTFGLPINVTPAGQDVFAGTLGLAASRKWERDTATLTAADTLAHFTTGTDFTGVKQPAFDQSVNTIVGAWRREWTERWSTELDAGLLQEVTLQGSKTFWQPTGAATIDYNRPWFAGEIAYQHAAVLNVYLAEVQLVDEVATRVSVPLGSNRDVTASATAAYERTRAISVDGTLVDPFDLWFADAGVAWAPHRVQNLALGARFSIAKQDPAGPQVGGAIVPGFVRETVLATVTYGYPAASVPQPAYVSPTYRAAPVTQRDFENADLRARPSSNAPNASEPAPALPEPSPP